MKYFLFYLFDIKSILSSKREWQQKPNQRLDISHNKYLDNVHISFFKYFLVYKILHAYTILVAFYGKSCWNDLYACLYSPILISISSHDSATWENPSLHVCKS